jgi:PPK2 family polyphosphate:nucleotide phosphotransferase
MKQSKIRERFRVDKPKSFRLDDFDPAEMAGFKKADADTIVAAHSERLGDLQERLYAEDRWSLLVILQGVDAAGKDGAIKRVMAGLDPQGCTVHPFKAPNSEELEHDFLWRVVQRLPRRGDIAIFNRSHYEDVLAVRVHEGFVEQRRLPPELVTGRIWQERFEDINAFERHLVRSGTVVVKFHLRISKDEQKRRLLARLDEPAKRWKFSMDDITQRKLWDRQMEAYEDMIRNTSTPEAPWYVVPADHKWFARLVIANVVVDVLEGLKLEFPTFNTAALAKMRRIRKALEAD